MHYLLGKNDLVNLVSNFCLLGKIYAPHRDSLSDAHLARIWTYPFEQVRESSGIQDDKNGLCIIYSCKADATMSYLSIIYISNVTNQRTY